MNKSKWLFLLPVVFMFSIAAKWLPSSNFQNQLNTILENYPTDFDGLKGAKNYLKIDTTKFDWKSTIQLEGCDETYIVKNLPTDTHLSLIVRCVSTEEKEKAMAKYKELVEQVKGCSFACCEMVSFEGKTDDAVYTEWQPKPGSKTEKKYAGMVLRVRMVDHAFGADFHFYSTGIIVFKR